MTNTQKQRIISTYKDLIRQLIGYELQYGMLSEDFYDKFQNGDLPEKEEYFTWQTCYAGLQNIEKSYPWLIDIHEDI